MATTRRVLTKIAQVGENVSLSVPTDMPSEGAMHTDHTDYYISETHEAEAGPVEISLARIKFQGQDAEGNKFNGTPPEAVIVATIKYLEYLDFKRPDKRYALAIQSLNASLDWLNS